MNHLITFMQSIQDIPAFCLNANGIIIATNQRAEEMEPGCIGLSIGDICPEYFGGNSSPDLSLYDSSRSFYAFDGKRLQLDRFGEYYLCRLLPESTVPFSDLTADPAALAEQAFTIRRSIRNLMDDFSMFEDLLDEFDILTEQMKEFYDVLEHGGATARKALLALNRIELSGDILANYPPQRVELLSTIETLLDKIRTTVPGLSLEIEVALSPLPVSVKANTTLLNRTILEVLRAIAQKAKGRPNKTVVKLSVIETMETVSVQMTDNIFGFTDPTKPRDISCSENVRRIAEAAVRPYGGSASVYSTDSGSAVELVFPLRADSWQIDLNPRLYSPLAYVAYRERGLSDTMVYLGDLTD